MQLTSPAEGYHEYTSLDLLIKKINNHAKTQGYAVTRKRSKHLNDLYNVSHLGLSWWVNYRQQRYQIINQAFGKPVSEMVSEVVSEVDEENV